MIRKRVHKLTLTTETLVALTRLSLENVIGGAEVTAGAPSRPCRPTENDTCLCAGR